jgi:hypothetical protein
MKTSNTGLNSEGEELGKVRGDQVEYFDNTEEVESSRA